MDEVLSTLVHWRDVIAASSVWQAVSSYQAQRGYAFAAAFLVSAAGIYLSRKPFRSLHQITQIRTLEKNLTYRGKKPSTPAGIAKREQRIKQDARTYAAQSLKRIGSIFLLGVGLPFLVVMAVTLNANWLFPYAAVLVDNATGNPVTQPGTGQLLGFAIDLVLKGGLNDFIEVFQLDVGSVRNDASNYLFGAFVLMFRFVADFFVIGLIFYAGRTLWNWRLVTARLDRGAVTDPDLED